MKERFAAANLGWVKKTPENIRRRSTREAPGLGSDIFRLIYQVATAFTGARPSDLFGRADSMGDMGDMPGMDGMGDMGDMSGMDGMAVSYTHLTLPTICSV